MSTKLAKAEIISPDTGISDGKILFIPFEAFLLSLMKSETI